MHDRDVDGAVRAGGGDDGGSGDDSDSSPAFVHAYII